MFRVVKKRKIMDGYHQRRIAWGRNHTAGSVNNIKMSGPRLDIRPAKPMPGFVQRNAAQPHVAYLDGRNCELAGRAAMRGCYPYDLPVGVPRQSRQTTDRGDSGATRNTMPALFDDGTDATTHHLCGRGCVDFLGRNRGWFFW